jgi:transposase
MTIPGIGILNATALIAAIGHGESFARGRDLAAWLGLVPRQVTTGGKPRLLGISKRDNKYLRKLLVHGARAALPTLLASPTSWGAWLRGLMARRHKNTVVVAPANELAHMAWVMLCHWKTFDIAVSAIA